LKEILPYKGPIEAVQFGVASADFVIKCRQYCMIRTKLDAPYPVNFVKQSVIHAEFVTAHCRHIGAP
jgi:hypothetical protein